MASDKNANPVADSTWNSSPFSRSLILVLCGYLVGITASHVCSPRMEACALGAAAIGMIGHMFLVSESKKRQAEENRLTIQKASVRLERRVELHVRIPSARFLRKMHATRPRMHEQYLSVVRSSRPLPSRHAYSAGS
jgi:hypothetical protein